MSANVNPIKTLAVWCVLFAVICSVGCGSKLSPAEQKIADRNKTNMNRLCNMYTLYQSKHGWQGPADEAALKKFIKEQEPVVLKRMGIEDVDAIFVSEVDEQPFEIKWAVAGSQRGDAVPIVFEKTGKDGKRRVGFTRPPIKEVDDAEYKKLKG